MHLLAIRTRLFRSVSWADETEIYRTRYDLLERGADPVLPATLGYVGGRTLVDRLNVCDSREESAHDYAFRSTSGVSRVWGTVRIDAYPGAEATIADGGRAILGRETFRVSAQPGRDLLIVLRTAPSIEATLLQVGGPRRVGVEFPEALLMVSMDGEVAVRDTFRPQPGWNEHTLLITGNRVRSARPRVEVSGRYASFQYWFFQ